MVTSIKNIDVVEHQSDVLIYSTNVFLNCSGGVGSTLLNRYGNTLQSDLHTLLANSDVKYAQQGDIYNKVSTGMPYKAVFHTVPCDGFYETSIDIVTDILQRCMDECIRLPFISTVSISLLGCGYGHMEPEEFIRIAAEVLNRSKYSDLESAVLCIYDHYLYTQACEQVRVEGLKFSLA